MILCIFLRYVIQPVAFQFQGIYDTHIQLMGVPILGWEPPPLSRNIYATEVMSTPVVTFSSVENVGKIIDILTKTTYNGFPVVDTPTVTDGVSTTL